MICVVGHIRVTRLVVFLCIYKTTTQRSSAAVSVGSLAGIITLEVDVGLLNNIFALVENPRAA